MKGILEKEKREDLKVLLSRYDAALQKSKPRWIPVDEFHYVPVSIVQML